jgi:hypothetical protein
MVVPARRLVNRLVAKSGRSATVARPEFPGSKEHPGLDETVDFRKETLAAPATRR